MMRRFSRKELTDILRKHKLWLNGEDDGEKADLRDADLRGAALLGADLREADLREACLFRADLREACLFRTDLYASDLHEANLFKADLREANLHDANLFGTILSEANLFGANIFYPMACPDTGSFIGWKKAVGSYFIGLKKVVAPYIVKLLITEDAKRSSATGRKCRCNKAKVIAIENINGTPTDVISVHSAFDDSFVYEAGSVVEVDDFDENRFNECAPGIHFFINRQEAVNYIL